MLWLETDWVDRDWVERLRLERSESELDELLDELEPDVALLDVLLVETSDWLERLWLDPVLEEELELALWSETVEKLDIVLALVP